MAKLGEDSATYRGQPPQGEWVGFEISGAPPDFLVVHDWVTVWGVHCLRKSTFVDGKQVSEVYLPGPWTA